VGKSCLLIIDDSQSFRKLLSLDLAKRGYRVIEAASGAEGLALFSSEEPDGVLIDLHMPDMDGHAVLDVLARRSLNVPLIVISNESQMDEVIEALRSGAWDFVNKDKLFLKELDRALIKGFERAAYLNVQRERLESEVNERRRAEKRLSSLLEASPLPVVIVDIGAGTCLFASQSAADHFGVDIEEVDGILTRPFYPDNDIRRGVVAQILRHGRVDDEEIQLCRKDGTCFWTQVTAVRMELEGRPIAYISFSDITARKELSEALQKFKFIANASHDLMTLTSRDFVYEAANRAYLMHHGMEEKEFLGRTIADVWGLDNFEQNIRPHVEKCLSGEIVSYKARFSFPLGERRYYEVHMYPYAKKDGQVTHVATVSKDITESAEAHAKILESREYFRAIFESSLDPIMLFDDDLRIVDLNTAAISKFGFSRKAAVGQGLAQFHSSEESYDAFNASVIPALRGAGAWVGEWAFVDYRNRKIHTETAISIIPAKVDGAPGGFVAVVRDISQRLKAEMERKASDQRYRAVFESSGAATFILDKDGVVIKANHRFLELVEMSSDEVEGKLFLVDFIHPEDREYSLAQLDTWPRNEKNPVVSYEFRFVASTGKVRNVFIEVGMLPGTHDSIASIIDITERKYNETVATMLYRISNAVSTTSNLEDLYRRINDILCDNLNASNFFVVMLDESQRYLFFSYFEDEMDNFTGVTFDTEDPEVGSLSVAVIRSGRPLLVTTEPIPAVEQEELKLAGAHWELRSDFLTRLGVGEESMIGTQSKGWLGVPLKVRDEVVGVMVVQSYDDPYQYGGKDVSMLVSVSEQVGLAIEYKEMDRELVYAKEQAEAANESKNEFLANMSHEVRTPLNGVLGMLQLVQTTELTDEQKDYVDTALMSGRSLLSIINDILDFSKIEAGRLDIVQEPFSLRHLAQDVLVTFRSSSDENVELTADLSEALPEIVIGGKGRLRQILFNLVGNSVKFTEKGTVTISMHPLQVDVVSGFVKVLISVEDTGIGIPQDMIDHIFEPFTQVDGSYVRSHQGTGLGLGIVKRLVDIMGGSLEIDTCMGRGTSVHMALEFELSPDSYVGVPEGFDMASEHRTMNILVVEDNRVNRLLAARMLDKLGQRVETAEDALQALEKMEEQCFDAVFMDIQMPGMDGIELTKLIRSPRPGSLIDPDMRIIAMTAHAMSGHREIFLSKGMDDYIAKPVEMEDIRGALCRLWGSKE
jgi:PAS domain S-box-containing protein